MSRPKVHTNAAAKQRAYRERKKITPPAAATQPATPSAQYRAWRKELQLMAKQAERLADEMQRYAEERSEEWQETERAAAIEELRQKLEDLADELREPEL